MDGMRTWMRIATALLRHLQLLGRRQRRVVVAVLGHGREPGLAFGGHQQRLGARPEHTVPALELCAVDGEVGLVDQLVRIGAVLREPGDADRHRCADRLARCLDVEGALGDRAADSLGDLERLVGGRLGQQDRKLLPTEPGRHVVMTELRAEHFRDSLQDGVAGEVAVRVVDVAEEVEVGHDQRQRALEPLGAPELFSQGRREVARVEQARLGIDAGLGLQLRNAQRAVDEDQRRDREWDQPLVRLPEGVCRDAERGEHEVRGEVLHVEQTGLAEAEPARQPQHDREVGVVDRDEHEAADDPGEAELQGVVREHV